MAGAFDFVKQLEELRGGQAGGGLKPYQPPAPQAAVGSLHQRIGSALPNYTGSATGAKSIPALAGLNTQGVLPGGKYTDAMRQAYALAKQMGVNAIGGFADRNIAGTNKKSDHASYRALDFMTNDNMQLGQQVADALEAQREALRLKYLIWNGKINTFDDRGWRAYTGVNPHKDHPHASFLD